MPYVNTYEEIGEQETLDRIVSNTLTSFTDDRVRFLGAEALRNLTSLEELHLPNCRFFMSNSLFNTDHLRRIILDLNNGFPCGMVNNTISNTYSRKVIIYVPDELVDVYKNPQTHEFNNANGTTSVTSNPWVAYADRIYGISKIGGTQEWIDQEITDSWETIGAHVSAGDAAETYHLGMYKSVDLGSEGIINFQIIGLNQDIISGTNSTAQLTWCAMNALATRQQMNPAVDGTTSGTGTYGGWPYCSLRAYLSNTILPLFPSSVSTMIKSVDKVSKTYNDNNEKVDVLSSDKLFLFSRREINGTYEQSGPIYNFAFRASDYDSMRRTTQSNDNAAWWMRSVYNNSSWDFVTTTSSISAASSEYTHYVVFGFCT